MGDEPFTEEDFRMLDDVFDPNGATPRWKYHNRVKFDDLRQRLKQVMAEVCLMHQTHTTMRKEK